MTIETANRLLEMRKKHGFSQEELAERLGVSRQAVSKWERSEASPDTDNLIALAKLYGVSLDSLIYGTDESDSSSDTGGESADGENEDGENAEKSGTEGVNAGRIVVESKNGEKVTINIDSDGVKIKQNPDEEDVGEGDVHINEDEDIDDYVKNAVKEAVKGALKGKNGITVESEDGDTVSLNFKDGIRIKEGKGGKRTSDDDGYEDDDEEKVIVGASVALDLPYTILCVIAYLVFGCCDICGGWGRSWIVFLTIPLWYSLVDAVRTRRLTKFCYPVLTAFIYLFGGLYYEIWHPTWIVFITVAAYYPIAEAIDNATAKRRKKKKSGK